MHNTEETSGMQKTILIFSTAYLPLVGGAEIAVKEITDRLPEYRFVLYTAKIKPGLATREQHGAIEVRRVGWGIPLVDKWLLVLWAPLRALRVSDVHCVWAIMASYGGLAARMYCALRPRTKLLLTLQEGDSEEHIIARMGVAKKIFQSLFRRANHVQAISTFLAAWAQRMGAMSPVTIVPNGVSTQRFAQSLSAQERAQIREKCGVAVSAPMIITVSRLVEKNGVQELLEAVGFLPETYQVVFVGDGELAPALRDRAREKGWQDRVHFLGTISHEIIPSYLAAADVFCRPSRSEGLGNVFLEAMAAGVPVVATSVGGIPDIVTDRVTGLFCEKENPCDIAQKIKMLIEDAPLREQLIRGGKKQIAQGYDWNVIAQKMRIIFEKICALS